MPDARYPTLHEFWERLDHRGVEQDLRDELRARASDDGAPISRVGAEATVIAVAARLLPGSVPPRTLAAFLDQRFDTQLGRGDERSGLMPRGELIPAGFTALDLEARERHGLAFAELEAGQQDALLAEAEQGALSGAEGFDSAVWFSRVRDVLLLAFGSDPRGMVQMGFPGPSYQPGHTWLDVEEVRARAERKPGYLTL
jgi:hypothetical protein